MNRSYLSEKYFSALFLQGCKKIYSLTKPIMKHLFIFYMLFSALLFQVNAQDTTQVTRDTTQLAIQDTSKVVASSNNNISTSNFNNRSPYKTSFAKDLLITAAGGGLTALGVVLIHNKSDLTDAQLQEKTIDKIPFFDRGNAGYFDPKIDKDSYIPFYASFGMPVLMVLINKNEREHAGQILGLFVETMSIDGAMWTITAGTVSRSRPFVYGTLATLAERKDKNNQRSFYAGHPSASATATFFMAKVFQDCNPDSKLKPLVWVVAAAVPAVVAYMRYQSGFHFLSDNILGYALGAATGILIPQWHKNNKHQNISFIPSVGEGYKGFSMVYRFK